MQLDMRGAYRRVPRLHGGGGAGRDKPKKFFSEFARKCLNDDIYIGDTQ